ncbi:MAG: hypothetical protein WCF67_22750 [Chitinophagaceae bacterium]
MNIFEQFIGKQILKVYRVDYEKDHNSATPIAIFLQLDEEAGLLIDQEFESETTTVGFVLLKHVLYGDGIIFFETFLNELKPADRLKTLEGQIIKSIRVGVVNDKESGNGFVIKAGQYAWVVIEIGDEKLTIFNRSDVTKILFNSDVPF